MKNNFDSNSVIINILEGINELKSEVTDLQTKIDQLLTVQEASIDDTNFKRSKVRASTLSLKKYDALQLINKIIAKYNLMAKAAKRSEGSGLFIINQENGHRLHALLRNSGDYRSNDFKFNGFVSLNKSDISQYDLMLFSVNDRNNKVHWFVFTKKQFQKLLEQKKPQSNGMISIYLDQTTNGEYVDGREKNPIDIGYAVNQWSVLVNLIKSKEGDKQYE